jgi:hypothetical protein
VHAHIQSGSRPPGYGYGVRLPTCNPDRIGLKKRFFFGLKKRQRVSPTRGLRIRAPLRSPDCIRTDRWLPVMLCASFIRKTQDVRHRTIHIEESRARASPQHPVDVRLRCHGSSGGWLAEQAEQHTAATRRRRHIGMSEKFAQLSL